jgi:tetratricopeptide (TPR) repeat protein
MGLRSALRAAFLGIGLCGLVVTVLAAATPSAHAAKLMFGTSDYLNKIADTTIKGPSGESLYLGYKYSHHAFIAPYMLSDDGYILGVVGEKSYFKLPPEAVAAYQAQGLLPKPLPPYEIGFFDYLVGYMLWIIIAALGLWITWETLKGRKQAAALPFLEAARAHRKEDRLGDAIVAYDKALLIAPGTPDILLARAATHSTNGDIDKAIGDYSTIIRGNPKHVEALSRRGWLFGSSKNYAAAESDINRAIKLQKKDPSLLQMRGLMHADKGDFVAAVADFTAALKLGANSPTVLLMRAQVYDHLGQGDLAAADRAHAERMQSAAVGTVTL